MSDAKPGHIGVLQCMLGKSHAFPLQVIDDDGQHLLPAPDAVIRELRSRLRRSRLGTLLRPSAHQLSH